MTKVYRRLKEDTFLIEKDFQSFCNFVWRSDQGRRLIESAFDKNIESKIKDIKNFSNKSGYDFKDLLSLFMNKSVYKLFCLIDWKEKKLYDLLKTGQKLYIEIQKNINKYSKDMQINDYSKNDLIHLSLYLKSYTELKRVSNVDFFGLLLFIWVNMNNKFNLNILFSSTNFNPIQFLKTREGSNILYYCTKKNNISFNFNNYLKDFLFILSKYFNKSLNNI